MAADTRTMSPVSPDLLVEVSSAGERPDEIMRKLAEYVAIETPLVWINHPRSRTVAIHRPLDEPL